MKGSESQREGDAHQEAWRNQDGYGQADAPHFDLVYERAFLCALPRPLWARWATRVAEIVRPGGRMIGFFFRSDDERGPPFGLKAGEIETLLAPAFDLLADAAVEDSLPVFAGRERWQEWRRR